MSDDQIGVKITADATGVKRGTDAAKDEVGGLRPLLEQLNASFATLAQQMTAAMTQGAQATAEVASELKVLEEETERETLSLRTMATTVNEGVESFNKFKLGLKEIGEAYLAAFGVERLIEFSKDMGEAAEKIFNLSQRLGVTTDDIQQLQAMANRTGGSVDGLGMAMTRLDRAFQQAKSGNVQMQEALHALGIDSNGTYTQMQLLQTAMGRFAEMADGPAKNALALQTMGRAASEVIPTLNLTREQQEELNKEIDDFGVKNSRAVAAGLQLAESWNTNKNAMLGLKNIMAEELAPILTTLVSGFNDLARSFVKSYEEGGQAKTIMTGLGEALKLVAELVIELGADFDYVFKMIDALAWELAGIVTSALDVIVTAIKGPIVAFKSFADVMMDALTLNWGKVVSDFQTGLAAVAAVTLKGGAQAAKDFRDGFVNGMSEGAAADREYAAAEAFLQKLDKMGAASKAGLAAGHGIGTTGDIVATPGKQKEPKSRMSEWETMLDEQKVAQEEMAESQGTFIEMSKQAEADYWSEILKRADLTNSERLDVEKKYLTLRMEIRKDEFQAQIATLAKELDAAKGNETERLRIANEIAEDVKQKYGEQSAQFQSAQDKIVQIEREAAEQRRQLTAEMARASQTLAAADVADAENLAKHRVALGTETQAQLLSQERGFEQQKIGIRQQALSQQLAATDPDRDPVKYQQILDQMAEAYRAYQSKITQIDQQAQLQRTAIERQAINGTAQLWGQNIAKMVMLQQSFAGTVRSLYSGMVSVIAGALGKVIEQWIAKQIAAFALKRTAQAADGLASVTSNAGIAAAAAFASTAAIPIVGPELAPAAAAAAMAATMSFAPMASASQGFDIPTGVNPITQLHQEEMVLPAHLANPLRAMLAGGAANGNSPMAANDDRGGDFHYHDHTGTLTHGQIMANRTSIAQAMKQAHREGAFAGSPIRF